MGAGASRACCIKGEGCMGTRRMGGGGLSDVVQGNEDRATQGRRRSRRSRGNGEADEVVLKTFFFFILNRRWMRRRQETW